MATKQNPKQTRSATTKKYWQPSKLRSFFTYRIAVAAPFMLVFGGIGTYFIFGSHAATSGYVNIVGVDGQCLDNYHSRAVDYNKVQLYRCNGSSAQEWMINSNGTITNSNGSCLDVYHSGTASGTLVDLYGCNGSGGEQWAANTSNTIVNPESKLCLNGEYPGTLDGNLIQIDSCNGTAAQRWTLGPAGSTTSGTTPRCTPANPLAVKVAGNHLVNQCGTVVQLRGVDRSGTEYSCVEFSGIFDGPVDPTALGYVKAWGVNAVRVPLNEDCWLGINSVNSQYAGPNYQSAIETFVRNLNIEGFRVILDLHWNAPGTTLASGPEPMPDQDHSPAFWTSVATAFKSNQSVIFDIYNEPYPDYSQDTTAAWSCWLNGGTCPGVSFTAAGSQELVNDIRSTGATNVIMVGGIQGAGNLDHWKAYEPTDPLHQIAASIHIYYKTPSSPTSAPCDYESCWTSVLQPLSETTPIVIGEFGEFDCSDDLIDGTGLKPTQPSLMDWADQNGISYLAWAWNADGCSSFPALISNYNGTPTAYGQGIMEHLQALAGK